MTTLPLVLWIKRMWQVQRHLNAFPWLYRAKEALASSNFPFRVPHSLCIYRWTHHPPSEKRRGHIYIRVCIYMYAITAVCLSVFWTSVWRVANVTHVHSPGRIENLFTSVTSHLNGKHTIKIPTGLEREKDPRNNAGLGYTRFFECEHSYIPSRREGRCYASSAGKKQIFWAKNWILNSKITLFFATWIFVLLKIKQFSSLAGELSLVSLPLCEDNFSDLKFSCFWISMRWRKIFHNRFNKFGITKSARNYFSFLFPHSHFGLRRSASPPLAWEGGGGEPVSGRGVPQSSRNCDKPRGLLGCSIN